MLPKHQRRWTSRKPHREKLLLGNGLGRCVCGSEGTGPKRLIECLLFASDRAHKMQIETRKCSKPDCQLKSGAGPDLGDLGIFNHNNQRLYTHELLDYYTDQYHHSETPFHSFCGTTAHRYLTFNSKVDFVSEDTFRNVYFSFLGVEQDALLKHAFDCPLCPPGGPKKIIADGVAAGFELKHRLETLAPPTIPGRNAPSASRVGYVSNQALVTYQIRRMALETLASYHLSGDAPDGTEPPTKKRKRARDDSDDLREVGTSDVGPTCTRSNLYDNLKELCPALLRIFKAATVDRETLHEDIRAAYDELLPQVASFLQPVHRLTPTQIFAHETVLMLAPRPTWKYLSRLVDGTYDETVLLALRGQVPAIGLIAHQEATLLGAPSCDIRELAEWVLKHAIHVLGRLKAAFTTPPPDSNLPQPSFDEVRALADLHV